MSNRAFAKQGGAVVIMVALTLAVLLGFAGLVIDLGGLFVNKTELQSALDSCALSAALELNGDPDSLTRATNAGLTAGNLNKVNYQKSSAEIIGTEITFSNALNGSYSATFTPIKDAKYAQCTHQTNGIAAYFIQLVGGPSTNSVAALAKATLAPSQSSCPVPLGLVAKTGGTASNNYGYQIGEWVSMVDKTAYSQGEIGWFNLDGSTSASEAEKELRFGYCESNIGDSLGTNGYKNSIQDAWNSRFGIYKNSPSDPWTINGSQPDPTGYVYTSANWKNPMPQNAYSGSPALGSHDTATNFISKRDAFASYADTETSIDLGDIITGLDMKSGGFKILATSGGTGQHHDYGINKRILALPVLDTSYKVIDYACMLMLQPMISPNVAVWLEFIAISTASGSPCATSGLAGGSGSLVPVLVE